MHTTSAMFICPLWIHPRLIRQGAVSDCLYHQITLPLYASMSLKQFIDYFKIKQYSNPTTASSFTCLLEVRFSQAIRSIPNHRSTLSNAKISMPTRSLLLVLLAPGMFSTDNPVMIWDDNPGFTTTASIALATTPEKIELPGRRSRQTVAYRHWAHYCPYLRPTLVVLKT